MSKGVGIAKQNYAWNRYQQRQDWKLLASMLTDAKTPDWNLSVKKVDKYMESLCTSAGIDFEKHICGHGKPPEGSFADQLGKAVFGLHTRLESEQK